MTPLHPKANRQSQINRARAIISKGSNLLIVGSTGIGKSNFLGKLIASNITCEISLLITHSTIRRALNLIAETIHKKHGLCLNDGMLAESIKKKYRMQGFIEWQDIRYSLSRQTIENVLKVITDSLAHADCRITLFIDDLPTAPMQLSIYKRLLSHCQVIATINPIKLRSSLLTFSYNFANKITLIPLSNELSREIASEWIKSHDIRFDNDKAKLLLIKHIANISNGNPAAIHNLLDAISIHDSISVKHVKELHTKIGITTIDMTPALFIFALGGMAARQIYRGIGEMEMYIFSSIILVLTMLVLYLWRASNRIK